MNVERGWEGGGVGRNVFEDAFRRSVEMNREYRSRNIQWSSRQSNLHYVTANYLLGWRRNCRSLTLSSPELIVFTTGVRSLFPYYSSLFIPFISRSNIIKVHVQMWQSRQETYVLPSVALTEQSRVIYIRVKVNDQRTRCAVRKRRDEWWKKIASCNIYHLYIYI
jgi:hypothetical protein